MYIKNYHSKELKDGICIEKPCLVAVEQTIEVYINRTPIVAILATPEMLKELAIGYIICEGIVKEHEEIKALQIKDKSIYIEISNSEHLELWRELRSSGCVGVRWDENQEISVISDTVFKPDVIKKSLRFLECEIYKTTHGIHTACLIDTKGECVIKAQDVGRHNTFDKVVGRACLDGIDPSKHFLLSTGRQSAGMVLKAARANIPLVATKTAPLDSGIEAAKRSGVCLVGFVSDKKICVFTHGERLRI